MGVEYELKFAATADQQEAIRALMPDEGHKLKMKTTYFDAVDGGLSARRITLRLRRENDVCICTVKTPLPDGSPGEWECACEDIYQGVQKLCQLGAPAELETLTAGGVREVCGAAFTREAYEVQTGQGRLEIALDLGVLLGGGREMPLCEVEVELKEGPMEAADAFAIDLARAFGLKPERRSKFQRALALARGEANGI